MKTLRENEISGASIRPLLSAQIAHSGLVVTFLVLLITVFFLSKPSSAVISQQALRCDTGTVIGNSGDSTNFSCGAAGVPLEIGLLLNTSSPTSQNVRIGAAGNGPWDYAHFINNSVLYTGANVVGYSANISMMATTAGRSNIGKYELGYYDPDGAAGNFAGLFNTTEATATSTTLNSFSISFNTQSGFIPEGKKLAVRVWMRVSGTTDRPYFYAYSNSSTGNSSFYIDIIPNNTFSGYITDKSSGLPLSGVTVSTNTSKTTATNDTGFYSFYLPDGTYIVSAGGLYGYDTNSTTKTISGADVTSANISLSPAPVYLLSGYVTNQSNGAAISGATVTTNTSLKTTTNAAGYYSFLASNWTHLITASKMGYTPNSTIKTVNGAAVSNANISLLPLQPRILVATNRYVILDDWRTGSPLGPGFSNPGATHSSNSWTGINTVINATALFIDNAGSPLSGRIITFNLYMPNGTEYTAAKINATTNGYGLANFSFDMDARNYYGNWTVRASNGSLSDNKIFIYNWWGCGISGCNSGHSGDSPSGTQPRNSPYLNGRESPSWGNHNTVCTNCHQSFDGRPGGNAAGGANHTTNANDVHRSLSCDNINCHQLVSTHNTNAVIGSCYSSACHTPANRSDISNKSTLNSSAVSLYSYNNGSLFNNTFHTPSYTVPCIICHGPMHNITKPDETQRYLRNNDTEDTHCATCHSSQKQHNGSVNCTLCHSDDVHYIQVFARNASSGAYYTNVTGFSNPPSNCTLCHQNGTYFFNSLENLSRAGNYSKRRDPPQVTTFLEHSNDANAGRKWNLTPGYWNNSLQLTWCQYCHGNATHYTGALGRPSLFEGSNTVNSTISSATSWCASCHEQGYTSGANNYNDTVNTFNFPVENLLVPPEITGNASYGANQSIPGYFNHSSVNKDDATCKSCHGSLTSSTTMTGFMHNVAIGAGGGPDCISCHDIGGSAPAHVDVTAANDPNAIHKNMNSGASVSNATAYYANNKRCWFCHGNDGNEPSTSSHPSRYKTPRKCPDCHLPVSMGGGVHNNGIASCNCHFNIPYPLRSHLWNGTNILTPGVKTCYDCHNKSEMLIPANDPDNGTGSVYGGSNGGNNSSSHYGKKRQDLRIGGNENCSYCHQNTTTAFATAMIDPVYNSNISNHSDYSSNPGCTSTQCHNTGWIHNSTLTKPNLTLPNSTFCLNCHGRNTTSGLINFTDAVTGIKEKHNNSVNCTECHLNTSRDIHPVKYLLQNSTFNTGNSIAVTCITCHQTASVDSKLSRTPPKIPSPLYHSDNSSNGTIWNSYWTSNNSLTSCLYCHNDTKHKATALGRPANWKGSNAVNSSLNASTWCSSCHYLGYSNYTNMTSTFVSASLSVPPEITNGTYAAGIYNRSNYYNHSLNNYTDATCRLCHGANLSFNATITSFMHNVTWGSCTDCHYSFEAMNSTYRPDRYVDSGMYNTSQHKSLSCAQCHTKGHRNIGARKACEDCHAVQQNPVTDKDRHNITAKPSTYYYGNNSVVNITDCTTCHNSTLYNRAVATYGYLKPKDCDYCHTYPDKYYE